MDKPTMGQATEIQRLISQHNMTRQKLQDLLESGLLSDLFTATDYPTVDREAILTAMFQRVKVIVDYRLKLDDMIVALRCEWGELDPIFEHFHFDTRAPEDVEIRLFHLGREATTDEILAEHDKRGLRPATLPEHLAFGKQYPDLQRRLWIVTLGSGILRPDNSLLVPTLGGDDRGRRLFFLNRWRAPNHCWPALCRFATVRK